MERVRTGIQGLDELLEGGFPVGRSILLTGACGTGKSIFSTQFIYNGAARYSEPGLYVTLDERPELLREDMRRFGWDITKLENDNMMHIIDGSVAKVGIPSEEQFTMPATGFDLDKLLIEIVRTSKRLGAKRVAIDSIPALGLNFQSENEVRSAVLKLSFMLMKMGVTTLLVSETKEGDAGLSRYGVEEYVTDGVIVLHYLGVGTRSNRTLHIRKMRATRHSEALHPLEITDKGIIVRKVEHEYDKF